ncbi:MAG: DNA adenine methylase [Bacteroidota bacterium]
MAAKKNNTTLHSAKPFLKWAGSKRQLIKQFIDIYPQQLKDGTIENYYEPFLGSGAVFFDIGQRYKIKNAWLGDVNEDLVLTYKIIQARVSELTAVLYHHEKKYLALNKKERVAYFYEQRTTFNAHRFDKDINRNTDKGIARAAQLIFLNRTCFNGLFRVNSTGEFNTPPGDYTKPSICDQENLLAVSGLLAIANIKKVDYISSIKNIRPASFIYFDPPYRPLSATSSFTAYSKSAFTDVQQSQLAQVCKDLNKKGTFIMLSNSDTKDGFFDNLYKNFHVMRVPAKRMINSDASKRGHINEIVVTNYPV